MTETKLNDAERCRKLAEWLEPEPKPSRELWETCGIWVSRGGLWEFADDECADEQCRDFPNDAGAMVALIEACWKKMEWSIAVQHAGAWCCVVFDRDFDQILRVDNQGTASRAVFEACWAAFVAETGGE